ncbi:MAG: hypothetical protein LBV33_05010 [Lachnospiraceae bacterium]|nr:hypothetical protein [Lachnospiraceae bacterium]
MDTVEGLKKRLEDLAMRCYRDNLYTYTGFLNIAEQDVFHRMKAVLSYAEPSLHGGGIDCERQIVRFGSEKMLGYTEEVPIACVAMIPSAIKFAGDLSHRDFLGGLMHLGIERATLGDIIVDQAIGYVFCTSMMASFIIDNLEQIGRTHVSCRRAEGPAASAVAGEIRTVQATSERLDAVIARVYQLSRADSQELFSRKRVFLNGMVRENNSILLKPEDVVSVRGFGKFTYMGYESISKKGKKNILINIRK